MLNPPIKTMAQIQYQKSSLNAYSTIAQTIATGENVALQSIGEKSGCSIGFIPTSNAIMLAKPGLYLITVDATVTDNAASGNVVLNIAKNGTPINGATATHTVVDTDTDLHSFSIATLVKVGYSCRCVDNSASITFVNDGITAIYNNINVNVIKMA